MMQTLASGSERALILAPFGRDAAVAAAILREAGLDTVICPDLPTLVHECRHGGGLALIVEEVLQEENVRPLALWIEGQPAWSDFPIVILSKRGGGLERNPAAGRWLDALGNVVFLERPFHPTTLLSVVRTALRGRRRQYEARDRLEALRAAVLRQREDQTHLRLMVNELNHRVKNTLATVQSIVAQTLRAGGASTLTRDTLTSRILALSKAHDVLTNEQWAGADLGEIASQAAQPFRTGLGEARIRLDGPKVRLPPKAAIAVALAMHELATNAVKYGALSNADGYVTFTWSLGRSSRRRDLEMVWREIDGPRVTPPTRAGFGTRLIERGLASDLNGEVRTSYPVDGVVCIIRARLDGDTAEAADEVTGEESRAARRPAVSRSAEVAPPGP
jgi:two-component sensor histidine kinase